MNVLAIGVDDSHFTLSTVPSGIRRLHQRRRRGPGSKSRIMPPPSPAAWYQLEHRRVRIEVRGGAPDASNRQSALWAIFSARTVGVRRDALAGETTMIDFAPARTSA